MADEPISTATPDAPEAATPSNGTAAAVTGNGQPSGEATGQSATTMESFLPKDVDVNTLPPSVRAVVEKINKEMVRGFTEKTMKSSEMTKAEIAKATEAFKQKAETYDQIVAQQEFVDKWNAYVKERQAAPVDGQPANEVEQLKKVVEEIRNESRVTKTTEFINAWSSTKDDKGELLRPEFDKLESIEIPGTGESLLHLAINKAPGNTLEEKLQNGYEAAKKMYDSIFEEGKKSTISRMTERVRSSSSAPSKAGPAGSYSYDRKNPPSAKEARELAEKGIRLQ